MNLAEFLNAANAAGVRLAKAGGDLQLSPAGAVTAELKAAAAEHKQHLLALLPDTTVEAKAPAPAPAPSSTTAAPPAPGGADPFEAEARRERQAVQAEANHQRGELLVEDLVFALDGVRKELSRFTEMVSGLLKLDSITRFNAVVEKVLKDYGGQAMPWPSPRKDPFPDNKVKEGAP
jgi:hypothetical protein